MSTTETIVSLLFVSILWGFTNPLMKRASIGIEQIKEVNAIQQLFAEFKFLLFNWKYVCAFLINQCGSVLYYMTLGTADLSIVVPITNSLTFIFTTIAGHLMGEKVSNKFTYLGMVLVTTGVTLCVLDKSQSMTSDRTTTTVD